MNLTISLLAVAPTTLEWGPKTAIVMIVCNVIAIALAKFTMNESAATAGPELPMNTFFGGMGLPALIGITSFGHVLGAGAIMGLAGIGLL